MGCSEAEQPLLSNLPCIYRPFIRGTVCKSHRVDDTELPCRRDLDCQHSINMTPSCRCCDLLQDFSSRCTTLQVCHACHCVGMVKASQTLPNRTYLQAVVRLAKLPCL